MAYVFQNPMNNYQEKVSSSVFLWVLIFGSFYFMVKGIWAHAVISLICAVCTFGASWLIYPFFAKGIVRRNYLKKGWIEI